MTRLGLLLILIAATIVPLSAQQAIPAFEVASVKPNRIGGDFSYYALPLTGRVSMTNARLRDIIMQAYQINQLLARFLIVGGSDRMLDTRFDINAKPPDDGPAGQNPAMLRSLLSERFNLRTHTEKRQIPVYALKLVSEGRLGPKLRRSKHDCVAYTKARAQDSKVAEPTDANGKRWCGPPLLADRNGLHGRHAATLDRLIMTTIQFYADRPIVDMTGLTGPFEWEVDFALIENDVVTLGKDQPAMTTALREQLGLKLEPQTAPYDVLVIDQVTMPTPD